MRDWRVLLLSIRRMPSWVPRGICCPADLGNLSVQQFQQVLFLRRHPISYWVLHWDGGSPSPEDICVRISLVRASPDWPLLMHHSCFSHHCLPKEILSFLPSLIRLLQQKESSGSSTWVSEIMETEVGREESWQERKVSLPKARQALKYLNSNLFSTS